MTAPLPGTDWRAAMQAPWQRPGRSVKQPTPTYVPIVTVKLTTKGVVVIDHVAERAKSEGVARAVARLQTRDNWRLGRTL